MSNDFDDATQLGSIGHNPSVPSQPGQQQPAFHTPNLPEQPQADEDPEGTLLSAHGTTQPALPQQSAPATPNQPRFRQPMPQKPCMNTEYVYLHGKICPVPTPSWRLWRTRNTLL